MNKKWVVILGVQKCGTTSVANLLSKQEDVFVPSIKETYFFCEDRAYKKGMHWFLSEFYSSSKAFKAKIYCEATPFNLYSRAALERIKSDLPPDTKFIVCLRSPISRAYSAYWHQRRLGNETLGFEEALYAEKKRIAAMKAGGDRWWRHAYYSVGLYGEQLQYAFSLFDRKNFLIVNDLDLKNRSALESSIRTFLGIKDVGVYSGYENSNQSSMPRFKIVQRFINGDSFLKRLIVQFFPREFRTKVAKLILESNQKSFSYPDMDPYVANDLHDKFKEDMVLLNELGVDFPDHWGS